MMMAKACLEKDAVLNAPIPLEHRQVVHSLLIETMKNKLMIENWIPSDSNPYFTITCPNMNG
jgi:hypothetical protein